MTKRNKIIYWVTTGLLAFGMLGNGLAQILNAKGFVDIIVHLGYPLYFLYIIGVPKAARATIPKAGHGSARENPQAFNEAVLKFLAKPRP